MTLSVVYLIQTTVCYIMLDPAVFLDWANSSTDYGHEMYALVKNVCLINIVHALTLFTIALFIVMFTRKFKILNQSHYCQLGVLSLILTIVYLLPLILVVYHAYADARDSETAGHRTAMNRFFDIFIYIILKSEQGVGGFVLAVLIHAQLYALLFVMMWCALHIREIADNMKKLKDKNAGTYKGLELNDVESALERRQFNTGAALAEVQAEGKQGDDAPLVALAEDAPTQIEEENVQAEGNLLNDAA